MLVVFNLTESATAIQHVLRCLGYDGSDSKSIPDLFLLEMHPDELQWTKVSHALCLAGDEQL